MLETAAANNPLRLDKARRDRECFFELSDALIIPYNTPESVKMHSSRRHELARVVAPPWHWHSCRCNRGTGILAGAIVALAFLPVHAERVARSIPGCPPPRDPLPPPALRLTPYHKSDW